jgi:hypothetical protein
VLEELANGYGFANERVSKPGGLPLVLVTQPKVATIFRRLSQNSRLLKSYVPKHAHPLSDASITGLAAIYRY